MSKYIVADKNSLAKKFDVLRGEWSFEMLWRDRKIASVRTYTEFGGLTVIETDTATWYVPSGSVQCYERHYRSIWMGLFDRLTGWPRPGSFRCLL